MAKVIEAKFNGGIFACTEPSWKWDYGDRLVFSDIELPASYEVHFANKTVGTSVTVLGDENGVVIPAQFFVPGSVIYAWIFLVDGENGYTKYQVVMPILDRAQPSNEQPTPAQQSALDDAVARLNEAAEEMEQSAMTPEEREKLSGIEAGAEVNAIEKIYAWDRIRQEYVALPIVNKSVDIPRRADAIVPVPFTLTGDLDDLSVTSPVSPSDVLNEEYEDDRIEAKLANGSLYAGRMLLLDSCSDESIAYSGVIDVDDSAITYLYIFGNPSTDEWFSFASSVPTVEGVDNALADIVSVPDGGTVGQVLSRTADDGLAWVDQSGGGGGTSDYNDLSNKPQIAGVTLSGNKSLADLDIAAASDIPTVPVQSVNGKVGAVVLSASDVGAGTYSKPSGGIPKADLAYPVQNSLRKADSAYQKPSGGIPATDLASGVIPSVPSASSATPQALGTASAGSSTDYSRADHVHAKPTYSKSDVGLGNVDNVQQYSATNPPPYPVTSVNGQTGAVTLSIPSTASDVGAVAVAQGVAHAGEFVVVGSDGNVTTMSLSTWSAGSY